MNLTPDDPKLTAYALGELDASERAAVEAALARSPGCRRAVDEIRALGGELSNALVADAATALSTLPLPRAGDLQSPSATSSTSDGDCKSPALATVARTPTSAAAALGDATNADVGVRAPAELPPASNIIFLPWRQWRTVGLAAAAAVVMGFIVAKVWQREQPKPFARLTERVPAPTTRTQELENLSQRPTNQVAHAAIPLVQGTVTNSTITVIRTNGSTGTVSVNFDTSAGGQVIVGDFTSFDTVPRNRVASQNGTVTFADGETAKTFAVPSIASDPSASGRYYRLATPAPTTPGLVAFEPAKAVRKEELRTDSEALIPGESQRHWYFSRLQPGSAAAYPRYVENPFTLVASEPLSTFSTDVDTASYANVRRFLNQNQLPPRDAVRLEELLNYFSYAYAPPTGDQPFAAHLEVAGCPWAPEHRLLRVGLKGRVLKEDRRPPSNFVFLIDVSGSMSPAARLPLIKQSLRQLVKRMTENDRVSIVVYASASGTVLESTSAVNKELILAAIDRLEAGGSTNGGEGIQRAYDLAVANFIKGGVNRVLLCTDGDFNVGITDRNQLLTLISDRAKSGVFLTTLGVGDDNFKDATLQQLADRGNGNYHYLDTAEEGHKVLVEQMNATLVTIAKDVKVQIEFNPAHAAAYRLIGYEKRLLAKEDFNNDAKDAGEIGAGHTVTVLYEVVPAGVPVRGAVDPLKYQPNGQPTDLAAKARKELEAERAKLEAAVANSAKAFKPNHPKMLELASQLEELNKKLELAKGKAISGELLTLKLRYKAPDGDTSKLLEFPLTDSRAPFARASTDFKFASAVAEFGMLLKDSPFKGTATFASALEHAREGKGDDTHGYRAEFINLVAKAKALKP